MDRKKIISELILTVILFDTILAPSDAGAVGDYHIKTNLPVRDRTHTSNANVRFRKGKLCCMRAAWIGESVRLVVE